MHKNAKIKSVAYLHHIQSGLMFAPRERLLSLLGCYIEIRHSIFMQAKLQKKEGREGNFVG